ncbi:IclR family transcriptional regulator [Pseudemcibacter aquimaris]|uniref:IclR family transcriptional regulator n=1 Tax=Pseudemcibacter aquimaris TaxID=2857064 RepID=UPI0020122530|nr:IclR family transcriptional regulator [Pseudemcibacter aquimaris]MCC3860197.1 IclR family transcriptional regulator [Pseudemcibacter aquimaris]WDU57522.1 IclR family transcriptional regulator [Pseudemcibacter aquimaris]
MNNENKVTENTSMVRSISVTFQLLDTMVRAGEPMRITEIARQMGESKAKVHRHLSTLRSLGVVEQEKTSEKYRLGWKLFKLGQAAFEQFDLKAIAEPHMARLRDLTGQSAVLAVASGGEAVVISSMDSSGSTSLKISAVPGTVPPLTASAQGRIVLAYSSDDYKNEVLSKNIKSYNDKSITDVDEIKARLDNIKNRLYETAIEEVMLGFSTIAAPILDADNNLIGTVGIIGSVQFIADPPTPQQIAHVQSCASTISATFASRAYKGVADPF